MLRRNLWTLLTFIVLLGALGAGLGLQSQASAPAQTDVTVPFMRLGDEAFYTGEEIVQRSQGGRAYPDAAGRLEALYTASWTGRALDQGGNVHDAVRIERQTQLIEGVTAMNEFAGTGRAGYAYPLVTQDHRISDRALVRWTGVADGPYPFWLASDPDATSLAVDTGRYEYLDLHGPDFGRRASWQLNDETTLIVIMQGQTLRPGTDLSQVIGPDKALDERLGTLDHSIVVGATAMLEGRLAVPIYINETMTRGNPVTQTEWTHRTWWYTSDSAFPVLMERMDRGEAQPSGTSWRFTSTYSLASVVHGAVAIPWGPDVGHLGEVPPTAAEWSDRLYPTSGHNSRLPYRIEAAADLVEADAKLVGFTAWRAANPGWRLVGYQWGAIWNEPFGDARADGWSLWYSAPLGETVFEVHSRLLPSGRVVNAEPLLVGQEVPAEARFDPTKAGTRYATLASVDRWWQLSARPDHYAQGPNFIVWGMRPGSGGYQGNIGYGVHEVTPQEQQLFVVDDVWYRSELGYVEESHLTIDKTDLSRPLWLGHEGDTWHGEDTQDPKRAAAPWLIGTASASLGLLAVIRLTPLVFKGGLLLHSRLVKDSLLDNAIRDNVLSLIGQSPGISQPQLKAATGAGWSTLTYHIDVLRRNKMITAVRDGRHMRLFLVGQYDHTDLSGLAVLANGRTRAIHDLIISQPGIDRPTIARMSNVTPPAISWHLKRLRGAGLVVQQIEGRAIRYVPTDQAMPSRRDHVATPARSVLASP